MDQANQATRISLLEELKETRSSDRWSEFSHEYGQLLRIWLIGQNVDSNIVDDVLQETLVAVVRDLPKFHHNGREGAFRRWLRTILANRLRRVWANQKRDPTQVDLDELADSLEDSSSPLCQSWDMEHRQFVLNALLDRARKRFDKQTMELFVRIVLQEEPAGQIADEMGLSLGAVRVRQHRVLRSMQEMGVGMLD